MPKEMSDTTSLDVRYILHNAYPDGTFRGMEKSMPNLFDTVDEALTYVQTHVPPDEREWWSVVSVVIVIPTVRGPLDAVAKVYQHLFDTGDT